MIIESQMPLSEIKQGTALGADMMKMCNCFKLVVIMDECEGDELTKYPSIVDPRSKQKRGTKEDS